MSQQPDPRQILVWPATDPPLPGEQPVNWPDQVQPLVRGQYISVCKWPRQTDHVRTHLPDAVQLIVDYLVGIHNQDPWKLPIVRGLKGGWESWLQVELASHLRFGKWRWSREEAIFASKDQLVDLWGVPIGSNEDIVSQDALGVELKVEYGNTPVGSRFVKDIVKVLAGLKDDCIGPQGSIPILYGNPAGRSFPRSRGTKMLCLAITTNPEDLGSLDEYVKKQQGWGQLFSGGERVYFIKLFGRMISGGSRTQDTWLMWWEKWFERMD